VKIILSTLKKILFWPYERGSWQYDVMCVVILAFIFLVPIRTSSSSASPAMIVRGDEIGKLEPNNVEREIEIRLRQKYGSAASLSRIEEVEDSTGQINYVVYKK
jgi:hypothetical protein